MDLTHSDVRSILELVDAAEHIDELEIVHEGFRLHIVRSRGRDALRGAPAPGGSAGLTAPSIHTTPPSTPPPTPASTPPSVAMTDVPDDLVAVRAPMVGTFYRAPAPGERPFIEVGQPVEAKDTVCLIEVMKLFNSLQAGVDGEVAAILVDNEALVEYDQPLVLIRPRAPE
jgi:acetyl-CoA carboxylase biotin carboxyl carrier protein